MIESISRYFKLVFTVFGVVFSIYSFAQNEDYEAFMGELASKIDVSTLKQNPVVSYAESDSVFNSLDHFVDSSFKANYFNVLGQLNFDQGDYALALEYYLTALDFTTAGKNDRMIAKLNIDIGNVYYKNDDLKAASKKYEIARALALSEKAKDLAATAANNIGLVHLANNRIEEAQSLFIEGYELRKELKNSYLQAHSLQYMGMLQLKQNQSEKAIEFYSQALQLLKNTNEDEQRVLKLKVSVSNDLCCALIANEKKDLAFKQTMTSKAALEEVEDHHFYAASLHQLANIYNKLNKRNESIESCIGLIELAGIESYFELLQKAYALLSTLEEERGNHKKAIDCSRKSDRIKTKLRNSLTDKKLANERYAQKVLGNKKLLQLTEREAELRAKELSTQQRVTELLTLIVIMGLIAVISLLYSNRAKQKSNKQLIATNNLDEKQNKAIRDSQSELQKAKTLLEEKVEELEALTKDNNHLLGIVAHDLRTPLNSILGLNDLIGMELSSIDNPNSKEAIEHIDISKEMMHKMLNMIDQILENQKVGADELKSKIESINVDVFINKIIARHADWANKKNISVQFENKPSLQTINSDSGLLDQIISNLLSNAIKYSNPNSEVIIGVDDKTTVNTISVSDNGLGFTEEDQKKIYQPYQRLSATPKAGESSFGLGLSSVKKIADALGHKINIKTAAGMGSTFTINISKKAF